MMHSECISVVVPNYNNSKYIERCLNTLLSQSYENLEIIIIDDCSTDTSVEIISRYAANDKRVVPVFNTKNIGVAKNRHKGIMMSSGRYVTTIDSDDIYLDDTKLETEYDRLVEKREAGIPNSIVFSGIILLDKNENVLGRQNPNVQEGEIINKIVRRSCLIPRDFLFTKEQYSAAGGFDKRITIYEDWDLKIRLAKDNLFFYSGQDGIGYRRHGQGLSSASPLYHIWWLSYIFVKNVRLLRTERIKTAKIFSKMIAHMAKNNLKRKFAGK